MVQETVEFIAHSLQDIDHVCLVLDNDVVSTLAVKATTNGRKVGRCGSASASGLSLLGECSRYEERNYEHRKEYAIHTGPPQDWRFG
jgi:hypothetical protein